MGAFADDIRQTRSWHSDWFAAAKRFFLSGGAKPFTPESDDVDRIVDYATALESTLVPERDYNTRRISHRAAALVAADASGNESIVKLVKRFYDTRSKIVHGSRLGDADRRWLLGNHKEVEFQVRQVLLAALRKLPPGQEDRRRALATLYDPTDEDRGRVALDRFGEIKTAEVKRAIAAKIAQIAEV